MTDALEPLRAEVNGWAREGRGHAIKVPVQWLGGEEYCAFAREAGFARCRHLTIPDPTPVPDVYTPRHYESREAMQASRAIGSLLIVAQA